MAQLGATASKGDLMRTPLLSLAAVSLALAGCSPEPVDIPSDLGKAAPVCFLSKALSLRDAGQIEDGKTNTLTVFSATIKYAMIAASQAENFDPENTIVPLIPGDDSTLIEELNYQDYDAAVGECDKLFGISGKGAVPQLPESDRDANLSCYAMVQYMNGIITEDDIDTEGKNEFYASLTKRLEGDFEKMIEADSGAYAEFATEEGATKAIAESLRQAFAQGDPKEFVEACDKRFPAK